MKASSLKRPEYGCEELRPTVIINAQCIAFMETQDTENPILPAAGVRRNHAADGGAGPPSGGHYDDWTPNPLLRGGRVQSDHSPLSNALLRCRRPCIMATYNANTVREEARLEELAHCAD